MNRTELLDKAKEIVTGQREDTYGGPEDSFMLIGEYWGSYLSRAISPEMLKKTEDGTLFVLDPEDVAIMMSLLKIARLTATPGHTDSAVDLAGYAACLTEITHEYKKRHEARKKLQKDENKKAASDMPVGTMIEVDTAMKYTHQG